MSNSGEAADDILTELDAILKLYSKQGRDALKTFAGNHVNNQIIPKFLYHYTNDSGLFGILKSKNLWLNDTLSLNDPTELIHGIGIALKLLGSRLKSGTSNVKFLHQYLSEYESRGGIRNTATAFALCFSTKPDDLSQWRSYADNGRGYVVEFSGQEIEKSFLEAGPSRYRRHTFKVLYNDNLLESLLDSQIAQAIELADRSENSFKEPILWNPFLQHIGLLLITFIIQASIMFKNEAYSSEDEYRFVEMFQVNELIPNIQLRMRPYNFIRYLEIPWGDDSSGSLRKIIVGPASESRGERFAHDCRRDLIGKHDRVVVTKSNVPYRA